MERRIAAALLCLLAVTLPGALRAQDDSVGPAPDRPELKVLAHLSGEWTGTLDGDTSGSPLKLSSRWILEGHVLETTIQLNDYKSQMLRTYDKANQQYVVTYMDASGTALLMTARWDETQKQLTATGKQGGKDVTLSTQFVDDTTTKWTIGGGDNVITGVNRRNSR